MYQIYGIRHHGPGSTRSLLRALAEKPPDCLLIEAPADAEEVLAYAGHQGLCPPVAVLIYDQAAPSQASYLPFAEFSPEWQAIQYGLKEDIPIRFMDLPMSIQFQLEKEQPPLELPLPSSEQEKPIVHDPMGYIAELAGYTDSERWWDATFEQTDNEARIFQSIISLNTALRDELQRRESRQTQLREAHMRKSLRQALKDGFRQVAVVCGAWHAPVLHRLERYKQKNDNALLKGLRKRKLATTWVPWGYQRLAFQSGYRAGVISPAWYELLFNRREEAVEWWMARVAILLRQEGFSASPSHAMEATRLANALAGMRGQALPGIEEMKEAVLAVFCEGREEPLQLIKSRLIIGDTIGKVPAEIPQAPLQKDLESRIRSLRLTKFYTSAEADKKELDLRKPNHLEASHLIHQLKLLNVPWGTLLEASENRLGSFHENWKLHWQPDFIIQLIEAGMWGNTVYQAAANYVQKKATEADQLSPLVRLAREALLAGLPEAFTPLVTRLEDVAALTQDVYYLMEALPVLADVARYGDTRQTDVEAVRVLIRHLIPRICIGMPKSVLNIEEEPAREWLSLIVQNNRAIALMEEESYQKEWIAALRQLAGIRLAHPLLAGLASRMLYDKSAHHAEDAARQMRFALSSSGEAQNGALWLEGFLYGSGLLLIHVPELWAILDEWVAEIPEHHFNEILPLLRRAFANFSAPEREKMLGLARRLEDQTAAESSKPSPPSFDQKRAKAILPTLQLLLGLEES